MLTSERGSSIVEVVLAITLFSLLASSFWIALREQDNLLKRADRYSELDMQMNRLASMVRDNPELVDDDWMNDPAFIPLIADFNLAISTTDAALAINMAVSPDDDDDTGDENFTLTAKLYTVSANVSARKFSKKVLVIDAP